MTIKKKLRDVTKEQWDKNKNSLCNFCCDNCVFQGVNCSDSIFRNSWINNKEKYNDDFLSKEIEIGEDDD